MRLIVAAARDNELKDELINPLGDYDAYPDVLITWIPRKKEVPVLFKK